MAENAIILLLEDLTRLRNRSINFVPEEEDVQALSLCKEIRFLEKLLEGWEQKLFLRKEWSTLGRLIMRCWRERFRIEISERTGYTPNRSIYLHRVREVIEEIKTDAMNFFEKMILDVGDVQVGNSSERDSSTENPAMLGAGEQTVVGFEEEALFLKERLTRGPKKLEIISIVGMAGLGKTTLARKLYDDPLVVYHFYVRVWVSVSQEYRKRDLLLRLLNSVIKNNPNGIDGMSESELAQLLYKRLKGRVYFIVMDDMWDVKVWDDLKDIFPNDNNGSKIMFTSRHESVALLAKPSSPPLSLRFLTPDESWYLFQQKVFGRESFPRELVELGKQITKKCQGLPLAIVVVAGILANEQKTYDRWKQVAETLNSWMANDPQLWEKTVAFSYSHLPHHLKRCFLYFGVFPEDSQIPVWKLVSLWVAEEFVRSKGDQSMEDVAEGYLLDLIGRSLVLVSRRGYDGGVKVCGIHDLLRDFCIKQAEKEHFPQQISRGPFLSSLHSKHPVH